MNHKTNKLVDATVELSVAVSRLAGAGRRKLVDEARQLARTIARHHSLTSDDYVALLDAAKAFGAPLDIGDGSASTSRSLKVGHVGGRPWARGRSIRGASRHPGRDTGPNRGRPSVMKKHVILFLAANPYTSNPLRLTEECAEIQRELRMAPHRDDFRIESRWAVGVDELMRHLTELDPTVIHFCGHGGGSAGLLLEGEQGQPQLVSTRVLTMVGTAARSARVVVLNACYSAEQAEVLRSRVDCVVGMSGAISNQAARAFAIGFYGALGNRCSIGNAVDQGVAALAAKRLPDEVLPRCVARDAVDRYQVVLSDPASAHEPADRDAARLNGGVDRYFD